MADTSGNSIDLQKLITGVAEMELKMVNAGIEWIQACASQAAKASGIAGRTLDELRDDKASMSDAAQRFIDFGKDNVTVLTDVSARIAQRFADGVQQVISSSGAQPQPQPKAKAKAKASPAGAKATRPRRKRPSARAATAR